jgi:hypothetical protein
MSTKFGDFIAKFNQYKDEKSFTVNYVESRAYGWKLGTNVKTEFSKHLEEEWPDAPSLMKQNFKLLFEYGHDLLGIPVVGTCSGDNANKVFLLKITEKKYSTSFNNVEFKIKDSIITKEKVRCPITNDLFYWVCSIKMDSLNMNDSIASYHDSYSSGYKGNILNKLYEDKKIDSNDYKGVYVHSTINYQTGEIELSRNSDVNIKLLDDIIEKYKKLKSSGGGSGSGSGGDSGTTSTTSNDSTSTEDENITKDSDNYSVSCIVYQSPVKKLWEYEMT